MGGGEHVHIISYDLNRRCREDSVSEVNSHPSPDHTYSGLQLVVNVLCFNVLCFNVAN